MKLSLFAFILALATSYAQSNNAFWGQLRFNDTLVYHNKVLKTSAILSSVETDVRYPPTVLNSKSIHVQCYYSA